MAVQRPQCPSSHLLALAPFRWALNDSSLSRRSRSTSATNLACPLLRSRQLTPAVPRSPCNARRQKQAGMPKGPARPSRERQWRNQWTPSFGIRIVTMQVNADKRRPGDYAHRSPAVPAATELAGRRELEHGPRPSHGQRRLAGMSGKAGLSRSRKLTTETIGEVLCRNGY